MLGLHDPGTGLTVLRDPRIAIAAKLRVPARLPFEVPRADICDQIFNAAPARLVLIRAPAGFGKTTVMLQVRERLAQSGVPTAWLTLDGGDNDVGRFLQVLAAALDPLVPGLLAHGGEAGWSGPEGLALDLSDRIAAHPAPFTLFLDDFERLVNPSVLGLVDQLVGQLPRGAQFILGSRGMPDLALGWLRSRGRLLEIEPARLRLSVDETGQMLAQAVGVRLSDADVERLHHSTEGWAAAIRLASISLDRRESPERFIARFSGSHTAIVDYLVEDVLSRQPEEVRSFLLRTSILVQLDPAVCDALCERDDSAAMLRHLHRSHLFVTPLGGGDDVYRYHGMFAEFLRAQLARTMPASIDPLHRRASAWFLANGRPVPAIEYALRLEDPAPAIELLRQHAPALLTQGRMKLLVRWMDPLVAQGRLDEEPMLRLVHAWAVCFGNGARHAWPHLEFLEGMTGGSDEFRTYRTVLRPLLLALMDRIDEASPLGAAVLDDLPEQPTFARGILEITMANLAMYSGHYHQALKLVDSVRRQESTDASGRASFAFVLSEAAEGAIDLVHGRLRQALGRLRLAANPGAADTARATNGNTMAGSLLAEALYEAGRCDEAERLLSVHVPLVRRVGVPDQLITAHVVLARILLARQDTERALEVLAELEHIGYREQLPRAVASARLERVRVLAMQGRVAAARTGLSRCGDAALWERIARMALRANDVETPDVAAARCAIAAGRGGDVVGSLRAELNEAERAYRERRVLTLRILLAQAHHQDGDRKRAMRMLARAVCFAASEGYVRAFLDEGPRLPAMLHELHRSPTALLEGSPERDGDPARFIEALLHQGGHAVSVTVPVARPAVQVPAAAPAGEGPGVVVIGGGEILTQKEAQVLRLVAEGLSNEQLAERLFVAETTVRTHLRNINVKLDSRNRMEAVQAARRLGLIA